VLWYICPSFLQELEVLDNSTTSVQLALHANQMKFVQVLCPLTGLFQVAISRTVSPRKAADDPVPIPKFKSEFKKGEAPAQWADGYPKKWGSEDFSLHFNVPEVDDTFFSVITEDEKYAVMSNGSHATFFDLNLNATVSTFNLGLQNKMTASIFIVRSVSQGGYDILTGGTLRRYETPKTVSQIRVSSDLRPTGNVSSYGGGEVGDFDKNGRMATTYGYIYDLNSPATVTLKDATGITGMSFSGDGQYISTVGWIDKTADLWNATTGDKILQFPPTNAQNWLTKVSPDNKYVVISLGTGYLQIYDLANLKAEPRVLGPFNNWIRAIEWSPDSKYLATGDTGRMQLWKFPEAQVAQTWEVDGSAGGERRELYGLGWFDGGNKISWNYRDGRYMYDFQRNLKWWWTPGYNDHSWGGGGVSFLKKSQYVATDDGDSLMRFWKI
jgi:WD40 repeat protein